MTAPQPIALLHAAPPPGAPPLVLAREPGFAIKLLRPGRGLETPPGQGQLLLPLRGRVEVVERSDPSNKVTQTDRRDRSASLSPGTLWRVANDAAWTVHGREDAVLLQISTSVPREESREEDLFAAARGTLQMAPRRVFGNESLRAEVVVGRGPLPGMGWVPWSHRAQGVEFAIILAGRWRARLPGWSEVLQAGQLLRIPAGVAHYFAARTAFAPSIGFVLTSLRREPEGAVRKEAVQGFSPFVDRG